MSAVFSSFAPSAVATDSLRQHLLMLSLIKDIRTAIPVEVKAVHPGGGYPSAIGTVDVLPLVQTVNNDGSLQSLKPTYGVPYCRIQAGATAIVVDPVVGDLGLAIACDRDISSIIAALTSNPGNGPAGPGSARVHDISDLVYLFSVVSAEEITQYILANSEGIALVSPNQISLAVGSFGVVITPSGTTIDGKPFLPHAHVDGGGTGDSGPVA